MLEIKDKTACCGCQACLEACPAKCISMVADGEGFLYPEVRQADCIDCHLCEKVCPQKETHPSDKPDTPPACYAAISKDTQTRLESSSGGVFSALAEAVLKMGGVVFGARFDDRFLVYHDYTGTEEGISPFRGTKYVQSDLRGAYSQVQAFLQEKRPVLFTGTPCQIAGLRSFLRHRDEENLFLVSVVCHGAPSPRVWEDYLDFVTGGGLPTSVHMRNKDKGWGQYRMIIRQGEKDLLNVQATDTPFMRAYLTNRTIRPSCYSCRFRGDHGSDLTLGDYWGVENVHPELSDNLGTSLILAYSEKGRKLLDGLDLTLKETGYEAAVQDNPVIVSPSPRPADRERFWADYRKHGVRILKKYTSPGFTEKVRNLCSGFLHKIKG